MTEENLKLIENCIWESLKDYTTPNVVNFTFVKTKAFIEANPTATKFEIMAEVMDAVYKEDVVNQTPMSCEMIPDYCDSNGVLVNLKGNLSKTLGQFM